MYAANRRVIDHFLSFSATVKKKAGADGSELARARSECELLRKETDIYKTEMLAIRSQLQLSEGQASEQCIHAIHLEQHSS